MQELIYDTSVWLFFLPHQSHKHFQPVNTARCQPAEYKHTVDYSADMHIAHWEETVVCAHAHAHACVCTQGVKAKLARLYKQLLGHSLYLSTLIGM